MSEAGPEHRRGVKVRARLRTDTRRCTQGFSDTEKVGDPVEPRPARRFLRYATGR